MEKLLNVQQVAEILGVTPGTVYQYIYRGEIPYIKLNDKSIRFLPEEIEKWIKSKARRESLNGSKVVKEKNE